MEEPLPRSEEKLNQTVLKLLRLGGVNADRVFSTLCIEQDFFLIDRSLFLLRPDLVACGRTVFGQFPPRQEPKSPSSNNRVSAYLREVEEAAHRLGISVKTRRKEETPGQYEIAGPPEPVALAVDHHRQLMALLQQTASKHNLACLLHEEPFSGISGSVKRINWSLSTDTGHHLLDPHKSSLVFTVLQTAILRAAQEHADLLRASGVRDLTGGRGVVVSADCAGLVAILNAVVADRLQLILDEIADVIKDRKLSGEVLSAAVLPVLEKHRQGAEPVRSPIQKFDAFLDKKSRQALEGVFSEEELQSCFEMAVEQYAKTMNAEATVMIDLFETQILPAAQKGASLIEEAIAAAEEVKKLVRQTADLGWEAKARVFCELIAPKREELRKKVDQLETLIDKALWPLPKYQELLVIL